MRRSRKPGRKAARTFCLLALGPLALGCAFVPWHRSPAAGEGASAAADRDVPRQIELLKERMAGSHAPATARLHRDLAMLYVDRDNPAPDYGLALKELELYAESDAAGGRSREVGSWMAALRRLNSLQRERDALRREIAAKDAALARVREDTERRLGQARRQGQEARKTAENLARENAALADTVKRLRKENRQTKETIEKLKALDIELEELRRKIRR